RIHYASLSDIARGCSRDFQPQDAKLWIPYEWVTRLREEMDQGRNVSSTPMYQAVCVLWVSLLPDHFRQLRFLRGWQEALLSQCRVCPQCRFAINGRIGSSELAAMLEEDVSFAKFGQEGDNITLYVTSSTAPFVRTIGIKCPKSLNLEYLIDTDDR